MTAPTRPQGEATANQLLGQLQAAQAVFAPPPLPAALRKLGEAIDQQSSRPVRDLLMELIRPQIAMRSSFQFKTPVQMSGTQTQEKVLRAMGAGEGEYAFDLPSLSLTEFLAGMFEGIAKHHPVTKLYERDLFHGHVVPNEATRDVVIVFHAKEYPAGQLSTFTEQRYRDAGLLTANGSFPDTATDMAERNFLWTLRTNRVFLLADPDRTKSTADPAFTNLITPLGKALDQDAKRAGTVQERHFGQELFAVNYFPSHLSGDHQSQLYFAPVGQWAVLVWLEKQFPAIAADEIAQTYAANDDSRNATERVLTQKLAALKNQK
jgi:hypothetical protein